MAQRTAPLVLGRYLRQGASTELRVAVTVFVGMGSTMRDDGSNASAHESSGLETQHETAPGAWWVLMAIDRAWAWWPTEGLVPLTDLMPAGEHLVWDNHPLSPDGRSLRYTARAPFARSHRVYDLTTGISHHDPLPESPAWPFYGAESTHVLVTPLDHDRGNDPRYSYELHRLGKVTRLNLSDLTGGGFLTPPVQFTRDGDEIAVGHRLEDRREVRMSIVHLDSGAVERYDGITLVSDGAWSPSGRRLLVKKNDEYEYFEGHVFDRRDGSVTPLGPMLRPADAPASFRPILSGWLDDDRVLVHEFPGRRLRLWSVHVDSGERTELADLALPAARGKINFLRYAPIAAQSHFESSGSS